jgi:hypothetical protein
LSFWSALILCMQLQRFCPPFIVINILSDWGCDLLQRRQKKVSSMVLTLPINTFTQFFTGLEIRSAFFRDNHKFAGLRVSTSFWRSDVVLKAAKASHFNTPISGQMVADRLQDDAHHCINITGSKVFVLFSETLDELTASHGEKIVKVIIKYYLIQMQSGSLIFNRTHALMAVHNIKSIKPLFIKSSLQGLGKRCRLIARVKC